MFHDSVTVWILSITILLLLFFVTWKYFNNRRSGPNTPTNLGGHRPKKQAGIEISHDRLSKPDDRLPPPTR